MRPAQHHASSRLQPRESSSAVRGYEPRLASPPALHSLSGKNRTSATCVRSAGTGSTGGERYSHLVSRPRVELGTTTFGGSSLRPAGSRVVERASGVEPDARRFRRQPPRSARSRALESKAGIEPAMSELQTDALPLGYFDAEQARGVEPRDRGWQPRAATTRTSAIRAVTENRTRREQVGSLPAHHEHDRDLGGGVAPCALTYLRFVRDSNPSQSGDNRPATPSRHEAVCLLARSRTATTRLGNERRSPSGRGDGLDDEDRTRLRLGHIQPRSPDRYVQHNLSERRESNPRYAGPNGVCHQIHFALRVVGLGFDPSSLGLQPSAVTRFANRPLRLREPPSGMEPARARYEGALHPMSSGTLAGRARVSPIARTRRRARHLAHGAGIEPAMRRLTAVCLSAWLPVNEGAPPRRHARPNGSRERRDVRAKVPFVFSKIARRSRVSWIRWKDSNLHRELQRLADRLGSPDCVVGSGRIELASNWVRASHATGTSRALERGRSRTDVVRGKSPASAS